MEGRSRYACECINMEITKLLHVITVLLHFPTLFFLVISTLYSLKDYWAKWE